MYKPKECIAALKAPETQSLQSLKALIRFGPHGPIHIKWTGEK